MCIFVPAKCAGHPKEAGVACLAFVRRHSRCMVWSMSKKRLGHDGRFASGYRIMRMRLCVFGRLWYSGRYGRNDLWFVFWLAKDVHAVFACFYAGCGYGCFWDDGEKGQISQEGGVFSVFDHRTYRDDDMKKADGFVTVEYSLLVTCLFVVYAFLCSITLFLYNRCVLQSNMYLLAVEGAAWQAASPEKTVQYIQKKAAEADWQKYVLAENMQVTVQAQGNRVRVQGRGQLANPLAVLGLGKEKWDLYAESEATVQSPATTLRLLKKACRLLQEASKKEETQDEQ